MRLEHYANKLMMGLELTHICQMESCRAGSPSPYRRGGQLRCGAQPRDYFPMGAVCCAAPQAAARVEPSGDKCDSTPPLWPVSSKPAAPAAAAVWSASPVGTSSAAYLSPDAITGGARRRVRSAPVVDDDAQAIEVARRAHDLFSRCAAGRGAAREFENMTFCACAGWKCRCKVRCRTLLRCTRR